jgi:hypothetical protein
MSHMSDTPSCLNSFKCSSLRAGGGNDVDIGICQDLRLPRSLLEMPTKVISISNAPRGQFLDFSCALR